MRELWIVAILFTALSACNQEVSQKEIVDELTETAEVYRPAYHFTPPSQWMNDPNGMVYYEGEYHLFYQHYPDSNVWGPMHWGHAVSLDMIHWEHLPIALYPDEQGYIFSGSVVIDYQNTSGLGSEENPAMVAVFTYHNDEEAKTGSKTFQTQGIAYSLDKGRIWKKYERNPVLANPGVIDFRDPKVSWNNENQQWNMVLAAKDRINIYSSLDLIKWTKESEFGQELGAHGGVWECPDLFPLVDQNGDTKWVMLVSINPGGPQGGSATQYFVGNFDGKTFTPHDTDIRWVDYGADNYAGVTFSNVPKEDGRRLFIGWMSNWQYATVVPTEAWRSAMTLPRELTLKKLTNSYRVQSVPVVEINTLEKPTNTLTDSELELNSDTYRLKLDIGSEDSIRLVFSNEVEEEFIISMTQDELILDRSQSGDDSFSDVFAAVHSAPLVGIVPKVLMIYADKSSFEVFLNNGELVMTDIVFPSQPLKSLKIKGKAEIQYTEMKGFWDQNNK